MGLLDFDPNLSFDRNHIHGEIEKKPHCLHDATSVQEVGVKTVGKLYTPSAK